MCLSIFSRFWFSWIQADNITKEYKVLQYNYDKITSSITDIESLLSKLVAKNVISFNQEKEVMAKTKGIDKVKELLSYIVGPLKEGSTTSFYILLEIMESGNMATQELAADLKKQLVL